MNKPVITNVLGVANLGCELDLIKLATHTRNTEYNPPHNSTGFPAAAMKIRDPKTTANIYSNGKMVIAGAKSTKLAKLAAMKCAKIIQLVGFPVKFDNFEVRNVVGIYDFSFPIRLELFSSAYPDIADFEPELFPAVFYQMEDPKLALTVFVNGKVVITGGKSEDDISEAVGQIRPILWEFKKLDADDGTVSENEEEILHKKRNEKVNRRRN